MPRLVLNLLGAFQVSLDGVLLTNFDSDKTRALLAYLAVESDRPHRREVLAGLLWPNVLEASARQSLSQALSNLRRMLEDGKPKSGTPFILATRDAMQFNRESDHALDIERLKIGDWRLAIGDSLDLQSLISSYRAPFLDGFTLPSAEEFEEWLLLRRESLQRRAIELFDTVADAQIKAGNHAVAIALAQRQLELDPWREEAHRQLMRAYALNGHRSDALAQYEKCKQVLSQALGIEPGGETRALVDDIRRDALDQSKCPPTDAGKASPSPFQPFQPRLPQNLTPFVGREHELRELSRLIADPDARLITLVAVGGMGKTRLAIEAATQMQSRFPHGAIFVPLAAVSSAAQVLPAMAQSLGIALASQAETKPQVFSVLERLRLVCVLDNVEHLLADGSADGSMVELLVELLQAAPDVKLLVTSREILSLQGEWVFALDGLGDDARTLFTQTARRVHAQWRADEADAAHIRKICQLVGGMPLGVELAASWSHLLSCAEIVGEIERNIAFLATTARHADERHRSITAVLEHSWMLLSAQEQHALSHLALFSGGFTRDAAHAVAGANLPLLSALVGKSLVRRVDAARFDLHELIRQFAGEHIEARASAANIHAHYFVSFAKARSYDALPGEHHTMFAELGRERANIELALNHLLQHNDGARAARLLGALLTLWISQQSISRFGLPLLMRTRAWFAEHDAHPTVAANVQLLSGQLSLQALTVHLSELVDRLNHALAALRADASNDRDPSRHTLAYGLAALAWAHIRQGCIADALVELEECLTHFRQRGDYFGQAWALRALSLALVAQQRFDEGLAAMKECVRIGRTLHDPHALALALGGLGERERALGSLNTAIEHYAESAEILDQLGDTAELFMCQMNHCCAHIQLGAQTRVQALLRVLLGIIDRNGELPSGHPRAYLLLTLSGSVLLLNNDAALAAQLLSASVAVLTRLGSSLQPADRAAFDHIHAKLAARLPADELAAHWQAGARDDSDTLLRTTLAQLRSVI